MKIAPVILFVYNRPSHAEATIKALSKNSLANKTDLYIFSDNYSKIKDKEAVDQVRKIIDSTRGFNSITIIKREENLGLAKSIVSGINEITKTNESFIVLEDDIITSPFFLSYMNEALELYNNEPTVMHINGYAFPGLESLPESFFTDQMLCWGWASWKRAWKNFSDNLDKHLGIMDKRNDLKSKIYLQNTLSQLFANKNGKIKTWAANWQSSIIEKNGLCLGSNDSYTENIGHDGTGEHCDVSDIYKVRTKSEYLSLKK